MLVDTHAHIHFEEFAGELAQVFDNARSAKLDKIICVGTDDEDSRAALEFVWNKEIEAEAKDILLFGTAGLHPHEASRGEDALLTIRELVADGGFGEKLVAVGECGLDYYRNLSPRQEQLRALEYQIELALEQNLPLVFHVRDAWEDFFSVIQNYPKLRGVIHSFTGTPAEVELASNYDLYFGLNGIITFTKEQAQLDAATKIPKDKLLLETDCPFLSPAPYRGKRNEPSYVQATAEFLAKLRKDEYQELVATTSKNATELFGV